MRKLLVALAVSALAAGCATSLTSTPIFSRICLS